MRSLSNDMDAGHAAVREHTAGEAAPAPDAAEAAPTKKTRPPRPLGRQGFTAEVGLGLAYTSQYASKSVRLSAMEAMSIGAFLNKDLALIVRLGASLTGRWNKGTFTDSDGNQHTKRSSLVVDQLYLLPQAQWFPNDRFMLAAGIGATIVLRSLVVDVSDGDTNDYNSGQHQWGLAGSFRAGVTVYESKQAGVLRIGVEAVPSVIHDDWHTIVGLMMEGQLY